MKKVLITGAHFTPAVATIDELKKEKDIEIVYVGRKTTREGDPSLSAESQILPKLNIRFIPIITGRLQKDFTLYTIPSLLKIPIGLVSAIYILLKEQPDVILSFGGYVAVPLVFIGWLFSIPIIVHEQTLVSGLANKISSLFANKVALSFKLRKNDDKYIWIGNPLRKIILEPENDLREYKSIFENAKKNKFPVVLITGGNQGSHTINKVVGSIIENLVDIACVIHVTGENKFNDFDKLSSLGSFGGKYIVKKWIGDEYGGILSKTDLAISRAGANTLEEFAYLKVPALLIPIPYLYKNEQYENAKFFLKTGFVGILPQSDLSAKSLMQNIKNCLRNMHELKENAEVAKKIVMPDAAKRLALETILLA